MAALVLVLLGTGSSYPQGAPCHGDTGPVCQGGDEQAQAAAVVGDLNDRACPRTEECKEEVRDEQDESAPAWLGISWAASWADVAMVLLTVGLFFAALWIGKGQLKLMRGALADSAKATNAAVESARIARRDFLLTQRPKIGVRNVVVRVPKPNHGPTPVLFAPGHYVSGQLSIVNTGGTPARIIDCGYEVYCKQGEWRTGPGVDWAKIGSVAEALKHAEGIGTWITELPMERPYEGKSSNVGAYGTLASGESKPLYFQSEISIGPEGDAIREGREGWALWVLGFIRYADNNDPPVIRTMAFCRQWAPGLNAFITSNDPDYEHAD